MNTPFEQTRAFQVFRNAVAQMPKDKNAIVFHLKKDRQHSGPFTITVDLSGNQLAIKNN